MTAATTGLRQVELVALRRRDVDWMAGVIRVRRNSTRGQWGRPKSRARPGPCPLPTELPGELDRHVRASRRQADDDLVFAEPGRGTVLDASKLRKRFGRALERAGVRPVRFHDLRHTLGTRMAAAVIRRPPHGPRRRSLTPAHSLRGESLADCSPDSGRGRREHGACECAVLAGDRSGTHVGRSARCRQERCATTSPSTDRLPIRPVAVVDQRSPYRGVARGLESACGVASSAIEAANACFSSSVADSSAIRQPNN